MDLIRTFFQDLYGIDGVIHDNDSNIITEAQSQKLLAFTEDTTRIPVNFSTRTKTGRLKVVQYNAVYVELKSSAGTDAANYKRAALDKLQGLFFPPTYAVETPSGFQLYWMIHQDDRAIITDELYTVAQKAIRRDIGGQGKNAKRNPMAFYPGSVIKSKTMTQEAKIIPMGRSDYRILELLFHFEQNMDLFVHKFEKETVRDCTKKTKKVFRDLTEKRFFAFKDFILPTDFANSLVTKDLFINYVTQYVDAKAFFKIPDFAVKNFNTLSKYLSKCLNRKCQVKKTMGFFDIAMLVLNLEEADSNFEKVVAYMAKIFGVDSSTWNRYKDYREVLEDRKYIFDKLKRRKRNKPLLAALDTVQAFQCFEKLVEMMAEGSNKTSYVGRLIVPCAGGMFSKMTGRKYNYRMFLAMKFLTFIGFVIAVADKDIESRMPAGLAPLVAKQKQAHNGCSMQFYRIPIWEDRDAALDEIQRKIDEWLSVGLDIKKISIAKIQSFYGDRVASMLYPNTVA